MATKRRTKKRSRALATRAPRVKQAVSKARRKRRSKGLADAFTPSAAKAAGKDIIMGGAGGLATAVIEKGITALMPGATSKIASIGIVLAGSFLAHSVLKQPALSAGMAGALGYSMSKQIPFLNEDADFADEDALYDDAPYMDEYGNPLDENGDYLEEDFADGDFADGELASNYNSYDNY